MRVSSDGIKAYAATWTPFSRRFTPNLSVDDLSLSFAVSHLNPMRSHGFPCRNVSALSVPTTSCDHLHRRKTKRYAHEIAAAAAAEISTLTPKPIVACP